MANTDSRPRSLALTKYESPKTSGLKWTMKSESNQETRGRPRSRTGATECRDDKNEDRKSPGPRTAARWRSVKALAGVCLGLLAWAVTAAGDDAPPAKPIDFAHDIAPLIKAHCAKCHTDGTYKGSFSLDTREAMLKSEAVVPGKSGESELIERVMSDDPDFRMPSEGKRLTADEVARLKAWIDQGLPGNRVSRSSGPATPPR